MLQTLFLRCCAVSLAGAGAVLALELLQLTAGRTLGVKWQYYSWLPLLLVLLAAPLLPLPSLPAEGAARALLPSTLPAPAVPDAAGVLPQAHAAAAPDWLLPAGVLWAAVAALLLLRNVLAYRDVLRGVTRCGVPLADGPERELLDRCRAAQGVCRRIRLYRSASVDTPLLAGMFRPVIVLPDTTFSARDLRFIFAHELTHCRRHDLAYKWLAVLACSLHWFNPTAHFILRRLNLLCELSCDQSVAAHFDAAERRQYMQTILRTLSASIGCRRAVTTAMGAGRRAIEKRLTLIQQNRYPRRGARVIGTLLTAVFAAGSICLGVTARAAVPVLSVPARPAPAAAPSGQPDESEPPLQASGLPAPPVSAQPEQTEAPAPASAASAPARQAASAAPPQPEPPSEPAAQPAPEAAPQAGGAIPTVQTKYLPQDGERGNYAANFPLKPGVGLETIRVNAERDGRTAHTDSPAADLSRSYQIADYAVDGQTGAQQTVATVTPDENGLVTVYLDSEYADWLYVNVVDAETGAVSGQTPGAVNADPSLALSFPGLDTGKTYDVVIQSSNDTDHTITGTAIVY